MRILVISDIHSNYSALDRVLDCAMPYDAVWCLGDLVGYGADPNECIERVFSLPGFICVLGNHDAAVCGHNNIDKFNDKARECILFTQKVIKPANMDRLKSLPEKVETEFATLVHGSPRNPIWEYMIDPYTAFVNFSNFSTPIAITGHTHLPVIFNVDEKNKEMKRYFLQSGEEFHLTGKSILNPGSTGQPRDHDPRASFAILDTDTFTWRIERVEYDVQSIQKRILDAGLPAIESQRLSEGW